MAFSSQWKTTASLTLMFHKGFINISGEPGIPNIRVHLPLPGNVKSFSPLDNIPAPRSLSGCASF